MLLWYLEAPTLYLQCTIKGIMREAIGMLLGDLESSYHGYGIYSEIVIGINLYSFNCCHPGEPTVS